MPQQIPPTTSKTIKHRGLKPQCLLHESFRNDVSGMTWHAWPHPSPPYAPSIPRILPPTPRMPHATHAAHPSHASSLSSNPHLLPPIIPPMPNLSHHSHLPHHSHAPSLSSLRCLIPPMLLSFRCSPSHASSLPRLIPPIPPHPSHRSLCYNTSLENQFKKSITKSTPHGGRLLVNSGGE